MNSFDRKSASAPGSSTASLLDNLPDLVARVDGQGRLLHANASLAREFSPDAADNLFLGKTLAEVLPGATALHRRLHEANTAVFQTGAPATFEAGWPAAAGERRFEIRVLPERDESGKITSVLWIAREDAPAARASELRLLASLDRINRAILGAPDLDQMMSDVLDTLLTLFECDRVFLLYPCDPDAPMWRVPMERTRPEYPGAYSRGDEIPMTREIAATFAALNVSPRPVRHDPESGRTLPDDITERYTIRSMMTMALHPRVGKPWVFGLHQCSRARVWTADEEKLLQEAGWRLTDALTATLTARNLRDANQRIVEILESITDAFVALDRDWRYTYVNERAAQIIGKPRQALLGSIVWDHFSELVDTDTHRQLAHAMTRGAPAHFESHVASRGLWFESDAFPTQEGIAVYSRDISERKRIAAELASQQEKLSALLAHAPDAICRYDPALRFTYANPACEEMLGVPAAGLLGKTLLQIFPGDRSAGDFQQNLQGVFTNGRPIEFEVIATAPGRQPPPCHHCRMAPEHDACGRVASVLCVSRDISALKATERQYRTLTENSPDLISRHDLRGRFLYINRAVEKALRTPPADLLGKTPAEAMPGDPASGRHEEKILQVAASGAPLEFEMDLARPEGRSASLLIQLIPERDDAGKIVSILSVSRDITPLKQTERHFRTLSENSPDLIARFDRDQRCVYANTAIERTKGIPLTTILGKRPSELAPQAPRVLQFEQKLREVVAGGKALEFEVDSLSRDGTPTSTHVAMIPERDGMGNLVTVLCICRDTTTLKEKERQFRSLAEHSPDIICRFNRQGRCLYANPAVAAIARLPADALVGARLDDVLATSPSDVRKLSEAIEHIFSTGAAREPEIEIPLGDGDHLFNVRLIPECNLSGQVVNVLLTARDITERKRIEDILVWKTAFFEAQVDSALDGILVVDRDGKKILQNRRLTELWKIPPDIVGDSDDASQVRFVAGRTKHPRQFAEKISYLYAHPDEVSRDEIELIDGMILDRYSAPVRDKSGRHYGRIWTFRDITERRALEAQFRQSQKMDAIGQLAGGIAHDFNNLLSVIQMQASMMLAEPGLDRATQDGIQDIMAASKRAANLTRQLLTFSRREPKQARELDLAEVIAGMSKLLQRVLGEDIAFESRLDSMLPLIHADPGMMEQILMNLAVNARDAMPSGGRLVINLFAVIIGPDHAKLHPEAAAGPHLCLTVGDTGCGIPPENLQRIFEPFFTTKEVGKGTGLGLATVFGIVQQHRGWIEVDSKAGEGAQFRIFLPALPRTPASPATDSPAADIRGGVETILVVEDEPEVRALTTTALRRYGYRVIDAESAVAALQMPEDELAKVQLLVTDLVMPGGVTGRQLTERLVARKPSLKVLFTSGYSDEIVDRQLSLDPGRHLLRKPYAVSELAIRVRRLLDGPPASG